MEDEEYRAYLVKQSYENLLYIKSSLDNASYPARYAMVLEEIDARGNQSPRSGDAAHGKLLTVAWVSCACLVVPILNFAALIATPIISVGLLLSKHRTA